MRYLEIICHIQYAKEIRWFGYPETVLRSVLGANLRRVCCIVKSQDTCFDCELRNGCVYSWLFESPIDKESVSLNGRDKAPHPFVLEYDQISTSEGKIKILLMGKAMYFAPYIISAFRNAGDCGLGRERIHFGIESTTSDGKEFSGKRSEIENHTKEWKYGRFDSIEKNIIGIELITPCRIKSNGKYLSRLLVQDILKSIQRRMVMLEEFYGEPISPVFFDSFPYSLDDGQKWEERKHVSSRTSSNMSLGGVVGKIKISGNLDEYQKSLLHAGSVFHVGKNVAFGLGKMKLIYGENGDDRYQGTV